MNKSEEHLIEEAFDRTVALLWPPSPAVWFRIALIVFFLGGCVIQPFGTDDFILPGFHTDEVVFQEYLLQNSDPIFLSILLIFAGGIAYVIISSIFQFVFVDCLSSDTIILTRTLTIRIGKGVRLMIFYLFLLGIVSLAAIVLSLLFFVPVLTGGDASMVDLLIALITVLVLVILLLIPVWVLAILTADFVVPVMILDDTGIIAGWRSTLTLFQGNERTIAMYTGLKIVLIIASGVVLGAMAIIISIPLGLLGDLASAEDGIVPLQSTDAIISLLMGTGAMVLTSLVLLVPVITFFRYYSLVVLGNLNPAYTLLPPLSRKKTSAM